MRDIRQDYRYAKYISQINWQIEKIDGVCCFVKKIPILGYVVKIQRPEKVTAKIINFLLEKYKPFRFIIEPKSEYQVESIKYLGFKQSHSPFIPSATLEIDLTQSKENIFSNFKKDTRYSIRKSEKVKIKSVNDIKVFRENWKKAVGLKRYITPLSQLEIMKKEFGKNCIFLMTENGSAGGLFLGTDEIAYYWAGFVSKHGRAELAQYQIIWNAIFWAKKNKNKIFDFEGIYDERFPQKSWKGFTHFKKSFGGTIKQYPGAYVKKRFGII